MVSVRLEARTKPLRSNEQRLTLPFTAAKGPEQQQALPRISPLARAEGHRRLMALIEDLAKLNPNPDWWYLPVSEFQPVMSRVLDAVELQAHLRTLFEQPLAGEARFVLTVSDPFIAQYLMRTCNAQADWRDQLTWAAERARTPLRRLVNSALWLWEHLRARRSVEAAGIPSSSQADTLFVSRFEADLTRGLPSLGRWHDRYLGDLPLEAAGRGTVALVGRCGAAEGPIAHNVGRFQAFPVSTMLQWLTKPDLLRIICRARRLRLRGDGTALHRLAVAESRNHIRAVADCLVVQCAIEKLLPSVRPRRIICMQENSVWEHAVVMAARRQAPQARLIGYFHCPVMPSALRYHCTEVSLALRPIFPETLTLGPTMAAALTELGPWAPRLGPGYGFRNPDIAACLALPPPTQHDGEFRMLVLLGGMFDNTQFLQWIDEARRSLPPHQLIIKGHPVYGAGGFMAAAGLDPLTDRTLREATHLSMPEALRAADCVIYKGTTSGLSALAAGVPCLHIDHGGLLSDDTLFAATGLSVSVSTAADFRDAVRALMARSIDQQVSWTDLARDYARGYYDLTQESRKTALDWVLRDGRTGRERERA